MRLRVRLSTLLLLVVIAALGLALVMQGLRAARERVRAERARADVAYVAAQAELQQLQAVAARRAPGPSRPGK